MAILGSATFDVSTIDVNTISIGGVVFPVKAPSLEDVSAQAVKRNAPARSASTGMPTSPAFLSAGREPGSRFDTMAPGTVVPVTVEGSLTDGTPFTAADCVTSLSVSRDTSDIHPVLPVYSR